MIRSFQMGAIVKLRDSYQILPMPINEALDEQLKAKWESQLNQYLTHGEEVMFDPAFKPDIGQVFSISDFPLPNWIEGISSTSIFQVAPLETSSEMLSKVKGLAVFANVENSGDVILFQNFSRSHVIKPGKALFFKGNVFESTDSNGINIGNSISAIFYSVADKLTFRNYRTVNTFLPLLDYFREASDADIIEVLNHDAFSPEDIQPYVVNTNQWLRKHFAMLKQSELLDRYTVEDITRNATEYGVTIHRNDERIVFPADISQGKKLLKFLNEELYKGPITNSLYETNSRTLAVN